MTDDRSDEIDDPYRDPPDDKWLRKRNLADEYRASLHSRPDPRTTDWFRRDMAAMRTVVDNLSYRANLDQAAIRRNYESVRKCHERMDEVIVEQKSISADIGETRADHAALMKENKELREELDSLKKRVSDMSVWASAIEKWAQSQGKPKAS